MGKPLVTKQKFYKVKDIMEMLDVSKWKAYELMAQMNKELQAKGYIVIAGRVSARYFEERCLLYSEE